MISKNIAVLLLLATAAFANPWPASQSRKVPGSRIRGGENTVIEIHPHQVSIEVSGNHQCGGSIISEHYVITAGHCMVFLPQYMKIRAGTSFREKNGSVHTIHKYVRHEDYYVNDYNLPVNDVAIIKVKEPFVFDDTRQPIDLSDEEVSSGTVSVVTGWGNTAEGWLADQLQSLAVPVISKESCDLALKHVQGLGKGQMCTKYEGEGKKDACNGDSGGPLTADGKLVGIISYGDDCRYLEYPGMYTEIAYFYDWIVQNRNF